MSTKVDQTSSVEPRNSKMSSVSTNGPKTSMFAAKSGFVIPKNKLSGSMVQVSRGGKKAAVDEVLNEECTNQVQRKTKWAPDMTQDAAVRKGRVLAYQTRLDQITELLKLGSLEAGDNQDSSADVQETENKISNSKLHSEKLVALELERQEIIGEILILNPSYKPPSYYKPLMKEDRVTIPVKEYPGFNFLGLIFGSGGDNQKRLEKETGAKIQVHGTKSNMGEKVKISPPDGNEVQGAYEELHVNISAETFEKVDAAVAVIEMLITSVSGNLGAASVSTTVYGNDGSVPYKGHDAATPYIASATVTNQGTGQPMAGSGQTPPQGQFQYNGPWPTAGSYQTPMHRPLNASLPMLSNPVLQSSPNNTLNMASPFGPRPPSGLNLNIPNQFVPLSSQPPTQGPLYPSMPQAHPLGQSAPPRNFPISPMHPFSSQPSSSSPFPYTGSQPQSTGQGPAMRPLVPSLPQLVSGVPPRPVSDHSLATAGSSIGWSGASAGPPAPSLGPRNTGQFAPRMMHPFGSHPLPPQPGNASNTTFSSGPSNLQLNRPEGPGFASGPSSGNAPGNPGTGSNPNFTPVSSSTSVPPSLHTGGSGSFTFQPQQQQNQASLMTPRPNIQPTFLNMSHPWPIGQLTAPRTQPFRHSLPNSTSQPVMQDFPRAQHGNQIGNPQPHLSSAPYGNNPPTMSGPPRFPEFQHTGPPPLPVSQMRPRNYGQHPQMPISAAAFTPRHASPMPVQQNYQAPTGRLQNLMAQNQPNSGSGHPRGHQQFYDPFSPTSVPVGTRQQGGESMRKQENDPEYEDLMASVGVK